MPTPTAALAPASVRALTDGKAPPTLFLATPAAGKRFWEFFTANIRNKHTRAAYLAAAGRFSAWCDGRRLVLEQVQPVHVAGYVEQLSGELAAPSVKQHLAALRMLFDWLVVGQVIPFNPAHAVRGPKHSAKRGKTPVLSEEQARTLIQSIDTSSLIGLRDRALITLMLYTFARVGAVTKMKVQDFAVEGDQPLARLHEKGGKFHKVGLARKAEEFLRAYVDAAGIAEDAKGPLFRTSANRTGTALTRNPMGQPDVFLMIRRRAKAAGIRGKINCHTFRATGITEYLRKGGRLETAQLIANHESARTTGLYDRREERIPRAEMERVGILA